VDFDMRNPSIHQKLRLELERGVETYLEGIDATLDEMIVHVQFPEFAVLPCLHSVPGSSEVLVGERCGQLVGELKRHRENQIVLFDLPPISKSDDVLSFLPQLDAVVLVVGEGVTTRDQLENAKRILGDKPILSVVLNNTKSKRLFSL